MSIRRVRIRSTERAIVMVDERPVRYLGTGARRLVHVRGRVAFVRFQVEPLTARVTEEQAALIPTGDLRVLRLADHERAVVRLRGKVVGWLGAGEHCLWTVARSASVGPDGERVSESAVRIDVLDTSAVTALSAELRAVVPEADDTELIELALEDVVLPGELKSLLIQVTEAKAESGVIERREEAGAARLMPRTAQLLAESPELMRLKELETCIERASKVGKLEVALGEGALGRFEVVTPS